jgi:hypothetical protein
MCKLNATDKENPKYLDKNLSGGQSGPETGFYPQYYLILASHYHSTNAPFSHSILVAATLFFLQLVASLISWADHVRNEVLLRVKEQKNILHEISKRKASWIGHILRRNCLLTHVIEGNIKGGIEVTGRRGRRRRKLLDDRKKRRGYSHLKEEDLDRTMWRARFGRGFGPVARQTTY